MTNAPEQPDGTALAPTPQYDGPAGAPPQGPSAASYPPAGLRVRDRVWSMRTVVAAAITAVALSGAGGAALAAASNGSGSQGPGGQMGRGGLPGQLQQFQRGQLPPATTTSGGRDT